MSSAANEEKAKLQSAIETDRKKFENTKEGVIHLHYFLLACVYTKWFLMYETKHSKCIALTAYIVVLLWYCKCFFFWLLYINFDSTHNLVFLYKLLHIFHPVAGCLKTVLMIKLLPDMLVR